MPTHRQIVPYLRRQAECFRAVRSERKLAKRDLGHHLGCSSQTPRGLPCPYLVMAVSVEKTDGRRGVPRQPPNRMKTYPLL